MLQYYFYHSKYENNIIINMAKKQFCFIIYNITELFYCILSIFLNQIVICYMPTSSRILTDKDLKKLRFVLESIARNEACLCDKQKCLQYVDSIVSPRCCVCRKPLTGEIEIINEHKMHKKCRKRYHG